MTAAAMPGHWVRELGCEVNRRVFVAHFGKAYAERFVDALTDVLVFVEPLRPFATLSDVPMSAPVSVRLMCRASMLEEVAGQVRRAEREAAGCRRVLSS